MVYIVIKHDIAQIIAILVLVSFSNICVVEIATANDLVWRPDVFRIEQTSTSTQVESSKNLSAPCPINLTSKNDYEQAPPNISKLAEIKLDSGVTGIAWSPDGKYIATSENYDRLIKIWSFPSLSLLHVIDKNRAGSLERQNIVFSSDGKFLITTSNDISGKGVLALSIIDVLSGKFYKNIPGYETTPHFPLANVPQKIILSKDGKYLFVTFNGDPNDIYVYNTSTWSIVKKIRSNDYASQAGPDSDDLSIIDTQRDHNLNDPYIINTISIWNQNLEKFIYLSDFEKQPNFVPDAISMGRSTCVFAVGAFDSLTRMASKPTSGDFSGYIGLGYFVPDPNGSLRLWYPQTQALLDLSGRAPISSVVLSDAGNLAAFTSADKDVSLTWIDDEKLGHGQTMVLGKFNLYAWNVEYSPDGSFLAASGDEKVFIYKISPRSK